MFTNSGDFSSISYTWDFALARFDGYDLSIVGTPGDDTISVDAGTQPGTLKTTVNGVITDNIIVNSNSFLAGISGNDTIIVNVALTGGMIVDGGDGSDTYDVSFGYLSGTVVIADRGTDAFSVEGTPGGGFRHALCNLYVQFLNRLGVEVDSFVS